MYSACKRLLVQVRLNKPYQQFVWQSSRKRVFCDFINFSDPIFFHLYFRGVLRYKLNSFLVVMALHCLIMTALEETEYIRIGVRDFAKSLWELKNIFFQKRVFNFIVESIISFISFSKGPWELNKTVFCYLQSENLIYLTRSKRIWPLKWKKKSLSF